MIMMNDKEISVKTKNLEERKGGDKNLFQQGGKRGLPLVDQVSQHCPYACHHLEFIIAQFGNLEIVPLGKL